MAVYQQRYTCVSLQISPVYLLVTHLQIDISLHTGYTDLRYGAFVSQHKVQKFLSQLSAQGLSTSKLRLAEFYFSIWLNQYPYLVSNPLLSNGRDGFRDIDTVNNRPLVEHYMVSTLWHLGW